MTTRGWVCVIGRQPDWFDAARANVSDDARGDWPDDIIDQITATNAALAGELFELAQRLNLNPLDVTLAVIDIPAAATRRSLLLRTPAATEHLQQRAIQLSRTLLTSGTPKRR